MKRILLPTIFTLVIMLSLITIPQKAYATTTFSTCTYLKNAYSGYYLGASGSLSGGTYSATGQNLDYSSNQEWYLISNQDGSCSIRNSVTGYYLGWVGGWTGYAASGLTVKQYPIQCDWVKTYISNNQYTLSPKGYPGLYLGLLPNSISGSVPSLGCEFILTTSVDYNNNKWFLLNCTEEADLTIMFDGSCTSSYENMIFVNIPTIKEYALFYGGKKIRNVYTSIFHSCGDNCQNQTDVFLNEKMRYNICACGHPCVPASNELNNIQAETAYHHTNIKNNLYNLYDNVLNNTTDTDVFLYSILISGQSMCNYSQDYSYHFYTDDASSLLYSGGRCGVVPYCNSKSLILSNFEKIFAGIY